MNHSNFFFWAFKSRYLRYCARLLVSAVSKTPPIDNAKKKNVKNFITIWWIKSFTTFLKVILTFYLIWDLISCVDYRWAKKNEPSHSFHFRRWRIRHLNKSMNRRFLGKLNEIVHKPHFCKIFRDQFLWFSWNKTRCVRFHNTFKTKIWDF